MAQMDSQGNESDSNFKLDELNNVTMDETDFKKR